MIHPSLVKKHLFILITLLLLIFITFLLGTRIGYASLPFDRIISTILGNGTFKEEFILFSIRMPRMLITLLAGMGLALSGAILQSLTRNDLADPGIIGINSGAGVAITVFFLFTPSALGNFSYALPIIAFIGALLTAIAIYVLAYKRGEGLHPIRLILIGIGFSMAFSGLMVVLISSAENDQVDFIAKWIAGNIWGDDWPFILTLLPWLIILIPYTIYKSNILNLLALNEQVSIGAGVNLNRERMKLLLAAVALAASAVSVTGGIAFVGLMAPHIAKSMIGKRHQLFLPISILMGGWLLMCADIIGRNIIETGNLPAGTVVALIGAPYFLLLLYRNS
ncbi:iron ABC transporter permease [Filobacillus milosensis]|uniref:Iron ABC transporter permease n=1 Tax=Filobacillus milosensis TaxID=94137 RepID=A0A4Y8IPR4_9BACI|nr:iron ABC transporter permease [Filobacillus milosensis]TFB21771.1 iron ABC transporter permease [Filobacillus milosensis]